MVSLAIWLAAAMFLLYLGFVALGILAGGFRGIWQSVREIRIPRARPVFVRTRHDKAIGLGIGIAAIIITILAIYSTTL